MWSTLDLGTRSSVCWEYSISSDSQVAVRLYEARQSALPAEEAA